MTTDVNDDAIMVILLSLPAKTLTKFKSISKNWLSIISSDHFRRLHTLRHPKPPPSLLLRSRETSDFFYFDPLLKAQNIKPYTFDIPNPKILSSCNGLMLLQSDHDHEKRYYVYNPTTKQSRKIICNDEDDDDAEIIGLNLAFDPSKSIHYKIVCVKKSASSPDQCWIEVYASKNRAPEQISETFAAPVDSVFNNGVFCSGAVHWRISNPVGVGFYYDIRRNAVGDLPPVPSRRNGKGAVVVCLCGFEAADGHLYHLMTAGEAGGEQSIEVYELREDRSRWSLKYRCEYRREFYNFGMMSLVVADAGEARILVDHAPGKITAYGFGDGRCEEVSDCSGQPFYRPEKKFGQFDQSDVFWFGESLAPV